jgi:hypothetical protein
MPVGLIEGTETIIFYSLFIGESSPSSLAAHSPWGHSRLTATIIHTAPHPTTALPQHLAALFVLFGSLVAVTILQRLGWAYRHLDN